MNMSEDNKFRIKIGCYYTEENLKLIDYIKDLGDDQIKALHLLLKNNRRVRGLQKENWKFVDEVIKKYDWNLMQREACYDEYDKWARSILRDYRSSKEFEEEVMKIDLQHESLQGLVKGVEGASIDELIKISKRVQELMEDKKDVGGTVYVPIVEEAKDL